jgi:lipid-A-disaccharide synthase
MSRRKRIFLVAGEHSGDFLGAALMRSLNGKLEEAPAYAGVGGELMEEQGLRSLFLLDDVAVMGIAAVIPRLPLIIKRVYQTVESAISFSPDIIIIIDSPEFTHAIAKRIRRRVPDIPIIDYVSPSVWAWRPGRAKKMAHYIDHVLALLPFEPEAHMKLGGPVCSYVGHPLVEKVDFMNDCSPGELQTKLSIADNAKKLVVLPGSRPNEVKRLMQPFGAAVDKLMTHHESLEVLIPVVPSVASLVEEQLAEWSLKPHLLLGDENKYAAFNLADVALAASGTVTLELALAKVPMVVAYRVGSAERLLRGLVSVHSIVLANLVLGENLFPEFIQEECTPENLAEAVQELLRDSRSLGAQKAGLERVEKRILLHGSTPSEEAAKIVLDYLV